MADKIKNTKLRTIIFILQLIFCVCNKVDAQNIQYKYDKSDRLIQVIYPNQTSLIYTYDADGNRIQSNIVASQICFGSIASFYAGTVDLNNTYQWQVDQGSGYNNLSDDAFYSGATTNTLTITSPPSLWYGYSYRCLITGAFPAFYTTPQTLKIGMTWLGAVSTAWENPLNWSCSTIPDANTDVIVNSNVTYLPTVNFNASCRSLKLAPNATCTISLGILLIITGK